MDASAIQETVTWEFDARRQETNKKGHLKKKMEEDNHRHPINRWPKPYSPADDSEVVLLTTSFQSFDE